MSATILIIDDSPTEAGIVKKMLEEAGYRVLWSENAAIGIETAMTQKPQLILMDVVMPGMSGFQATRKLTKNPETQHIPILMLTTKDQTSDQYWGIKNGASKYMIKPPAQDELLAAVEELLA